jgi:hypothetical protein
MKSDGGSQWEVASSPAAESELLYTTAGIARWMGLSIEQVRHMIRDGLLPYFCLPGRTAVCALKSDINAAVRAHQQRWHERHPWRCDTNARALDQNARSSNDPSPSAPVLTDNEKGD